MHRPSADSSMVGPGRGEAARRVALTRRILVGASAVPGHAAGLRRRVSEESRTLRTLVVGDIHGCFDELERLLDRAGLSAGDQVVALGDIVDRGPQGPRVVAFFRQGRGAVSLMGNYELKHVRAR